MYVSKMNRPKDKEDVFRYVQAHGFATFVGQFNGRAIASHIPMYLNLSDPDKPTLLAHVAIANEIKHCIDGEQELLAIFMESHAYISSSWYDHVNVPTWNYVAVHVYGKARVLKGSALEDSIKSMVDQYEDGRKDRFHLSDMSTKEKEAHLAGIVGFEMSMEEIVPSYKLSQNRNDEDYHNVIKELKDQKDQGSRNIAQEMMKLRP